MQVSRLLDFSGKVVAVTGASQGIGAGIARRFAEAGASVLVHYRSRQTEAAEIARRDRESWRVIGDPCVGI